MSDRERKEREERRKKEEKEERERERETKDARPSCRGDCADVRGKVLLLPGSP